MSSALIWEVVKTNNSFIRKGINGTTFSAEPNNLYNKLSYKYSGLANPNTVAISAEGDNLKFTKSRVKNVNKPKSSTSSYIIKKSARKANVSVGKQLAGFRDDLKKAAIARTSAVAKSLRVKKAAAAKK